jgi:serine/threonine-protein kinase
LPQPGTLIEGKYEILGKIREGGMGTIYKVRHRLLDEVRVVKVMKPSITADEELKRRFAEEAKMATRLKHPNIGTIHDFALDEDGTGYLVMEFIDGVNLAELLHSKGPPGLPLVLEIMHQSLLALGYLHRRNVIHRDVAPDNLMLSHDEEGNPRIKLIDLGIAKNLDRPVELTSTGVFLGKLKYASPEQYGSLKAGEKLDGRSDLYCLGTVIYELLTEKRPFAGETPAELLRAHLFNPPIPFEESDPQGRVPADVRKIILRALEKRREDRYATAEEFDREVVALRHRYGEPGVADHTVQMISTVRDTPGATEAQTVTPSAQNRLDRRFAAATTPSSSRPELTVVPPEGAAGQPGKAATGARRPEDPHGMFRAAAAAVVILGAVLLLWVKPWKSSRPAISAAVSTPIPAAATPESVSAAIEQPTASLATALPTEAPVTPPPPTVAPRPTPASDVAERANALDARQRAARARADAERVGAAQKAPGPYGAARRSQADAERLLTERRFGAAGQAFDRAVGGFEAAQSEVERIASLPIATAPAPTARPEPPRVPTAVAVVVPPTVPVSHPEPTRPAVTEQDRIREVIHRYQQAQTNLDADLYAGVFPSVDRARIRAAFSDLRSQSVEISIQKIDVAPGGSTATVRAYEIRTAVPRVGGEQHVEGARVFTLERTPDGWVISKLANQ